MKEITAILINECKRGDRDAQKQLYYLSKDDMKYVALRYCPLIEDAQDTVQNAYLKIFKSIQSFDPDKGKFNTWATRILINEALMIIRKRNRHLIQSIDQVAQEAIGVTTINLDTMTLEEVRNILSKLPEDQRVVVNMYYFEQYSYKEMADMLGLKESSIRSKVSRARTELKSIWQKLNSVHYEFK